MAGRKQKRQSPEDVLIELARAVSPAGGPEISAAEFRSAAKRVGQRDTARLEWAVGFAQQSTENMSRGDLFNATLETAAFLHPELALFDKDNKSLPFNQSLFPLPEQVIEAKKEFLLLIESAAAGLELTFEISQLQVTMGRSGVSYQIVHSLSDRAKSAKAKVEDAKLKLAQLLGEHWGYIGHCDRKKHGCGRYFVKSRSDKEFCTKTCLNRSTTYRQRGKEPAA